MVAGMPENYVCNEQLIEAAEKSAQNKLKGSKWKRAWFCSGDSFVGSDELALATQQKFPSMMAVWNGRAQLLHKRLT